MPAEKAVTILLQRWLTNKEIADHLRVSENTIKSHVADILSKRGIHSRLDLPRHWPLPLFRAPLQG